MRNNLSLLYLLVIGIFAGLAESKAQSINLTQPTPLPPTVCQCDTLQIIYQITAPDFAVGTRFFWEATTDNSDWSIADTLAFTSLTVNGNPAGPIDTITSGNTKIAEVAIPCDQDPINNLFIRLRADDAISTISDTIFYDVLRKTDSKIDSIFGGFPNPYTPVPDWSFCPGDSIVLVAQNFGSFFQWKLNGNDILDETDDSLWVKTAGRYSVDTWVSAGCKTESPDTLIVPLQDNANTAINMISAPPVSFQIDHPIFNGSRNDSLQFCEGESPMLRAATDPPAGITFSYQWITDSITIFGDTVYYNTRVSDTNRVLNIDSSLIDFEPQRFYVIVDDGFCPDTSEAYYVFMDTMPQTAIRHRIYNNGNPGPSMFGNLICMKDSVRLVSTVLNPGWEYQWQRFTTSNTWQNLPNTANPGVDGTTFALEVSPDILPVQNISRYRLRVSTVTPQGDAVCTFVTDSVLVRYQPGFKVTHQPDPLVTSIGIDTINFCVSDSATLVAPATPTQMQNLNFFYNYQWATDAFDSIMGGIVPTPIPGATQNTFTIQTNGVYYVIIDDGICIDTSDAFYAFVDSLPETAVVPRPFTPGGPTPDLNLCLTDSVLLSVDTVVGWNYQWQANFGTGWNSLLNDTLPYLTVDTTLKPFGIDTILFRVQTSYLNRFGQEICPDTTDPVQVIFFNPPTLSFFPGDLVQLCANDSVLVIAQGNSLSYSWDGGVVLGPQRWITEPGIYSVTGTGVNGCTTTREVEVELFEATANAGPDISTTSGTSVTLSGSGGSNFRWFADKPIAWSDFLSQTVIVSYDLPDGVKIDTVRITLVVTNDRGCTDTDELLLIVRAPEDPEISNIDRAWNYFSPNDDGINDVWDISAIINDNGGVCRIMIMNRWGAVVYEEENFDGIWEGGNQGGTELPDGTYYYVLGCDEQVILKNAITLIRNK